MIRWVDRLRGLVGWRQWLAAFAAGAVAALSLPSFNLWPLLFLAVPAELLLIEGTMARSRWSGFLVGWFFGLGYFIVALHWIAYAFFVDIATYLWMMPFAVGGLAAFMAVYWGLASLAVHLFRWRGLRLVLGFAAMIAVAEWLRGHLFTGFPWAAPGLAVDGMGAIAQMASLIGMNGLTLLIMLWAGLPLAVLERRSHALALLFAALIPLSWVYGEWRLSARSDADVPGVRIRLVQPDIPLDEKWREDHAREILDGLEALSSEATPETPDGIGSITHVIWPESAVPFLIDESPVAKAELARLLGGRTVLMTGAVRRDATRRDSSGNPLFYNSIITFDGNAEVAARYDKWRLVPGGEFLPLAWLLEPLGFRKVVETPGNFATGSGPRTIAIPGAPPVAMLVCYEVIFPHELIDAGNRPAWIVNVTNDGWFGLSTGPWQHLAQARLRAIEQGLPVARAANTGISAVIDAYGQTRASLPLGAKTAVDSPLPGALPPTIHGRLGDWSLLLLVASIMISIGRSVQASPKSPLRKE
jgi:apolipoprotein N-acyltransferase